MPPTMLIQNQHLQCRFYIVNLKTFKKWTNPNKCRQWQMYLSDCCQGSSHANASQSVKTSYWNALLANWKIWTIPQVRIWFHKYLVPISFSSPDCEHQPGGSAIQSTFCKPGCTCMELLPSLNQEINLQKLKDVSVLISLIPTHVGGRLNNIFSPRKFLEDPRALAQVTPSFAKRDTGTKTTSSNVV